MLFYGCKGKARVTPNVHLNVKNVMKPISSAEFILNEDGSIYHLHLRPEGLADLVLTVGDPQRVALISRYFDKIDTQTSKREFVTHTGRLGNRRITVISTGIGTDNIDIVVNELDALCNIDPETRLPRAEKKQLTFLRVGTSGGLQPHLEPGTVLVSAYGVGLDNLMQFYDYKNNLEELELYDSLMAFFSETGPLPVNPYVFSADHSLLASFAPSLPRGITLTCPGFYGPQGRQLRGPLVMGEEAVLNMQHFKHKDLFISNFEMETSALFGLSSLLGHKALSCNVLLANRTKGTFSEDPAKEVDILVKTVFEEISAGRI